MSEPRSAMMPAMMGDLLPTDLVLSKPNLKRIKMVRPSLKLGRCMTAFFSAICNPRTIDPATAESVMSRQATYNPVGQDS